MSSDVRASGVQAQTTEAQKSNWVVCRAALSLFSIGCLVVGLVPLVPAATLSQAPGAAIEPVGNTPEALLRPTLKPGSRGSEVTELQATLKLLGYYGGTVDGVYGQSTVAAVAQFQQAAGLNADGITGAATWNRLFPSAVEPAGAAATAPTPAANSASPLPAASGSASFPTPSGVSPAPSSVMPAANPRPATKPAGTTTPKPSKPATETRPTATATSATETVALPVLRQGAKGSAVIALQERLRSLGVFKGAADGVFGAETLAAVKAAQRRFKLDPDGVVGGGTWSALLR